MKNTIKVTCNKLIAYTVRSSYASVIYCTFLSITRFFIPALISTERFLCVSGYVGKRTKRMLCYVTKRMNPRYKKMYSVGSGTRCTMNE